MEFQKHTRKLTKQMSKQSMIGTRELLTVAGPMILTPLMLASLFKCCVILSGIPSAMMATVRNYKIGINVSSSRATRNVVFDSNVIRHLLTSAVTLGSRINVPPLISFSEILPKIGPKLELKIEFSSPYLP